MQKISAKRQRAIELEEAREKMRAEKLAKKIEEQSAWAHLNPAGTRARELAIEKQHEEAIAFGAMCHHKLWSDMRALDRELYGSESSSLGKSVRTILTLKNERLRHLDRAKDLCDHLARRAQQEERAIRIRGIAHYSNMGIGGLTQAAAELAESLAKAEVLATAIEIAEKV